MAYLLALIDDLNRELYNASLHDHDFGYGLHPHHIHIQALPQLPQQHPDAIADHAHHHLHHQREPTIGQILGLRNLVGHRHTPAAIRKAIDEKVKREGQSLSSIGKDGFQVCMDVAQFMPNELNVKVIGNDIVVEGKHEERQDDHGYITRHFVRRYTLPKDYDPDRVVSTLSSDGVLTVSVPKPQAIEDASNARHIQIQQTGPAHLNIKANAAHDAPNGDDGK